MAALNFPSSPSVNDTYVNGGVTYIWDGTTWKAVGSFFTISGGGSTTISGLTDVTLTNLQSGDQLLYNATTSSWINAVSFVPTQLNDLVDVDLTTTAPTDGQVLSYNSATLTWNPVTVSGGATVAGSNTQVQYNDNGSLGASAALTFSDPGGASRRLQVGDDPGNPSQNFVGEILTDNLNAQGSISALTGGYFGGTVQIEGNGANTALLLGSGSFPVSILDNNYSSGIAGQVLSATGDDGGGNATGVVWSTLSGLQSRTTASATTSSIADGTSTYITITAAKTYALQKIQTDYAAWVTLYTDTTSRANDATRTEFTDPTPGSGVIAEVITSGAVTQKITPGTIGWNDDATPSSNVYLKVVNKSGSTQAITVTLHYVQLED